ncbi:MAG: phosphotransferase [Anaerolineae bacterium]|nr:phosphotransferase [Anaerolineae bacterium]
MMRDNIQRCLQACYAQAFPARSGVQVSNVASITSGWENEMYAFDVEYATNGEHQHKGLVLRIYPGEDGYGKSAHEFQSICQLYQMGYPVPWVLLLERKSSPFGKPYILMERVEGQELWSFLLNSPDEKKHEMLTLFCELFVRLHRLDWRPFVDDVAAYEHGGSYLYIDRWLNEMRRALGSSDKPDLLCLDAWLQKGRNEVPCLRPSPLHWDFHPSNVLLRADGSPVVIDWTGFRISDARFDLAWTLVLTYSYVGAEWRDRILHEYERILGARVEQIGYFEVCACCRRLLDLGVSLAEGAEKMGMRPGAVAIMKQQNQVYERVYALLQERTGIRVAEIERMLAALA